MSQTITYIQSKTSMPNKDAKNIPFKDLVKMFSVDTKEEYIKNLTELGYVDKLKSSAKWMRDIIRENRWDQLKKFPFLIAFQHKKVYSATGKPKMDYLLEFDQLPRTNLTKKDFLYVDTIPDATFNVILANFKKGEYSLFKALASGFLMCVFNADATSKKYTDINTHSGMLPIDIDIKIDNDNEVLKVIGDSFPIYTQIYSPSLTIRPIVKIDTSDKMLKNVKKWSGLSKSTNPELIKILQKVYFEKISQTLLQKNIMSNGTASPLVIDQQCSNPNRIWYLGWKKGAEIIFDENATTTTLTEQEFFQYNTNKQKVNRIKDSKSGELFTTLESVKIKELTEDELDYINSELINTTDEIVKICKKNKHQPLYNGTMYGGTRDLYYSIKNVATLTTVEYIFTELMALTKLDTRITNTEYKQRNYNNYIVPTIINGNTTDSETLGYAHIYNILKAVKKQFVKQIKYNLVFLNDGSNPFNNSKYIIKPYIVEQFMIDNYFRLVGGQDLYKKEKHLVSHISTLANNNLFMLYADVGQKIRENYSGFDYSDEDISIITSLVKKHIGYDNYLSKTEFKIVNPSSFIKRDTKKEIYIYSANKKITITKDKVVAEDYTDDDIIINDYITKTNTGDLINFSETAKAENYIGLPFYEKMAGDNYLFAKCLLGYLISTYRAANDNNVPVLFDGINDSNKGGGTGKSLLARNVSYIRQTFEATGLKANTFMWGNLTSHTNVNLDDTDWNHFGIENIKPFTEGRVEKRAMNKPSVYSTTSNTPRLCISSNFTPNSTHESFISRCIFFNPTEFFNRSENPADVWLANYHNLETNSFKIMEDESESDWAEWLAFMIECCKCYLEHGINKFKSNEMIEKKALTEAEEFLPFQILNDVVHKIILTNGTNHNLFISSKQLKMEWNDELRVNGLAVQSRIGTKAQIYINSIVGNHCNKDYKVTYHCKSSKCKIGSKFSGISIEFDGVTKNKTTNI